jgi:uncharacterized protein YggE
MKKILLIVGLIVAIMAGAQQAVAQSEVPLMVVRYNQARIYYDKQLYNVTKKAVSIKPDVNFSIVSFVPKANDQEAFDAAAHNQVAKFVKDLRKMGVPASNINVTTKHVSDARHHELYLYVD